MRRRRQSIYYSATPQAQAYPDYIKRLGNIKLFADRALLHRSRLRTIYSSGFGGGGIRRRTSADQADDSGWAISSRLARSASTPQMLSTIAATIIRPAASRYPSNSATREPVSISRPNNHGATIPPTAVPAA